MAAPICPCCEDGVQTVDLGGGVAGYQTCEHCEGTGIDYERTCWFCGDAEGVAETGNGLACIGCMPVVETAS